MAYVPIYSEVPAVQSAEELLDWLAEVFKECLEDKSFLLLDSDDIAALLITAGRFRQNRTRNNEQSETDTMKENNL